MEIPFIGRISEKGRAEFCFVLVFLFGFFVFLRAEFYRSIGQSSRTTYVGG